jgi:DNA-directed RNA polymerase subunit RPC12/RpoP
MPVRIVDPTPDPKVEKQISCKQCGARLAYVPLDILRSTSRDISGCSETIKYIVCPNCGSHVTISSY